MPKYIIRTPYGKSYTVNTPEGATEDDAVNYVYKKLGILQEMPLLDEGPSAEEFIASAPVERGFGRSLSRAGSRGFSRIGSMFTDIIPAVMGSAVGADEYARQQMEEAAAKEAELQRYNPPQFPSFKDVQGPGDILPFIGETLGEQGANIAAAIGTGGVGSFAGRTIARRAAQKQLDDLVAAQVAKRTAAGPAWMRGAPAPAVEEAAKATVARRAPSFLGAAGAKGMERGAVAGAVAGSVGLNAPEIFQNIYETTGEFAPSVAILGGAFAGALDSILPIQLMKIFKSSPAAFREQVIKKIGERKQLSPFLADMAAKTAVGVGKGAATEGLTESAQEAISIAAEKFVQDGEQLWGSEDFDRLLEAGVRGAVAGGGFGIAPGVADTFRTRGIEAEEFARRAPPPPPETPVGTPDEGIAPPVDAGPLAERSALSGEPLAVPAGAGVGLGPEEIKVGLNREVAPEVRDVEWEPEDSLSMLADEQRRIDEEEQRQRIEAERTAIEDIAKETPEFESDQTPVEAPKVITSEELSKFGFSKDSLVMKTLSGMPYATPEQVEEIRSIVSEKIKNPNQRQKSEEFLKSLGAPESKVSPPIPLALSKEELIPAIEQDKNAYAAIERLAGRKAALDQLAGDQYVGAKGLLQEEVLPFSGPEQQKQYQDYVSPEDRRYVQNRITGLKAAEKRQEYRTKQEVEQAQLQEMPQEIEEALGEEGAFEQIAVPEITQIPEYRKKLSSGLAKYVKSGRKKPPPWQKEYSELKKYLELEGNSELEGTSKSKDGPMLEELRFMETPAAEQGVSSPEAFKREVKKFLGREPETEDIRVTTTPSAAKMKGVPKKAVAQAELGGKKATFFTKRIPSGKEISVFMHEVGTHVGMKNLVGETNYKYLIDKVNEWAADPKKEQKNEIARAALARIPESTPDASKGDEAIAYFVSEAVERGVSPRALAKVDSPLGKFFKYIMQGIKDILTQLGLPGYEPTTQDIIDIAYGAAQLTYDRAAKAQKKATRAEKKAVKETPAPVYMEAAPTTDEEVTDARYTPPTKKNYSKFVNFIDGVVKDANPAIRPSLEFIVDLFTNLSRLAKRVYLGLLSITQVADVVEKLSPTAAEALRLINKLASNRDVSVTNRKQQIEDFILKARKVVSKYDPKVVDDLYTFMHESSIGLVKFDIDKRHKEAVAAGNKQLQKQLEDDYARVQSDPKLKKLFDDFQKFEAKYPELSKLYYDLRDEYKKLSEEFTDALNKPELLGAAGKTLNDLMKKRIDPYFPLYRRGDYWVRYKTADGEIGVSAFQEARESREFVRFLQANNMTVEKEYIKPTEAELESMMPLQQMQGVIKILKEKMKGDTADKNDPANKARDEIMEGVYAIYLDMFSNQSVMQAFNHRKGRAGYRNDALANFADVGTRMAINIEQFNSVRKIDEAISKVVAATTDLPPAWGEALRATIKKRESFLKNPVQKTMLGRFASVAGHNAYRWFILGNISSAVINLTQLPIVVAPMLGGKFGLSKAIAAMYEAQKMYWKGGQDNNTTVTAFGVNLSDRSFAGKNSKLSGEYQRLYSNAVQRGAIRRSTGQDLMAMRELGVADPENKFEYKKMQTEQFLGYAFQNTERFNREVTLLAAYKLARESGMSEAKATDYALDLIEFAHGNAMSELGPEFFQTGLMKLVGVFKRFALSQIYLQFRLAKRIFAGADSDVKKEAAKQFMGINAAAFAFAGLKGMPIYGGINLMASMFSGLFGDDDDPFDLDEWALATLGSAGFRGPVGALLNVNLGTRTGFGDLLWRPDEKRLKELGLLTYALEQAGGPALSIAKNSVDGVTQMIEGDFMKGMETALPSLPKSFMRSFRFATEGVKNSKGFKIVDDPGAMDIFLSLVGFTPNDVSDAYSRVAIAKGYERQVQERRAGLLDALWAARQAGDYDGIREINKEIYDFNNSKRGRNYRITPDTIERSYEMRKKREREAVFGASFNPRIRQAALQEAGVRE